MKVRGQQKRPSVWRRLDHTASLGICAAVPTGVILLVAMTILGCSETARYRTLSFFFDGVPVPGEEANESVTDEQVTEQPEETVASWHSMYRERQCFQCHRTDVEFSAGISDSTICRDCHASYFPAGGDDWPHGAVTTSQCNQCHVSVVHESQYPSLLKDSQPQVCWNCHNADAVLARAYHADAQSRACSSCHDPHGAGNPFLLADSRTYSRRGASKLQSEHAPWKSHECEKCHDQGLGSAITNPDASCPSCHAPVIVQAWANDHHEPVRKGKCSWCHQPHNSTLPNLLRPLGEKICYRCHDSQALRTSGHITVTRADCSICHAGHTSSRPHLLKTGIPTTR